MTEDELELRILERYVERHQEAETADPERRDKCARELDMREVLRELTGDTGAQLKYRATHWLVLLAPDKPGAHEGPLRRCSNAGLKDSSHAYHARAFLDLSSPRTSAWERIRELERIVTSLPTTRPGMTSPIRLFISHSSDDEELARRLIELVRAALNLPANAIRCTSVDGYRLPGGADTDEQLRTEVHDAEAFIGIVSTGSIKSMYVLFELGARWGIRKHLLPLLASGTPPSVLGGPLAGLNALRADNSAQLHQMVEELGRKLDLPVASGAVYQRHIDEILRITPAGAVVIDIAPAVDAPRRRASAEERDWMASLGDAARELLSEAVKDKNGVVMVTATMAGVSVQTNERSFTERGSPRSEARWKGAARELEASGCLEDRRGKGEVFFVTDHGFRVADVLEKVRLG